jgi:hypothetical protein
MAYYADRIDRAPRSLAQAIEHGGVALAVDDRERHGVLATSRWVDEGPVADPGHRRQLPASRRDAGLDGFSREKHLEITPELCAVLRHRTGRVLGVVLIHDPLGDRRVGSAGVGLPHQHRVVFPPVVGGTEG